MFAEQCDIYIFSNTSIKIHIEHIQKKVIYSQNMTNPTLSDASLQTAYYTNEYNINKASFQDILAKLHLNLIQNINVS